MIYKILANDGPASFGRAVVFVAELTLFMQKLYKNHFWPLFFIFLPSV